VPLPPPPPPGGNAAWERLRSHAGASSSASSGALASARGAQLVAQVAARPVERLPPVRRGSPAVSAAVGLAALAGLVWLQTKHLRKPKAAPPGAGGAALSARAAAALAAQAGAANASAAGAQPVPDRASARAARMAALQEELAALEAEPEFAAAPPLNGRGAVTFPMDGPSAAAAAARAAAAGAARGPAGEASAGAPWGRPSRGGSWYDERTWLKFICDTVEDAQTAYFQRVRRGARLLTSKQGAATAPALALPAAPEAPSYDASVDDVQLAPVAQGGRGARWLRGLRAADASAARSARAARRAAYFASVASATWASSPQAAAAQAAALQAAALRGAIFDSAQLGDAALGAALAALAQAHPLGAQLGEGANADVYASEAGGAVLKCSRPFPGRGGRGGADGGAARGLLEARLLAAMPPHPNVARLLAAYIHRGRGEAVLLLADAGRSAAGLRAGGALTPRDVRRAGAGVAAALAHCHTHGIAHRDVKPANVLLDATGEPTLVDFGSAALLSNDKASTDELGLGGGAVGTWGYVAPEALLGAPLPRAAATACDAFALGATLYALATGRELLPEPGIDAEDGADEADGAAFAPGGWETDADVARAMGARFTDWALTPQEAAALGGGAVAGGASLRAHLAVALAEQPPAFRDLVETLLQKNPTARPTLRDAMRHPGLQA